MAAWQHPDERQGRDQGRDQGRLRDQRQVERAAADHEAECWEGHQRQHQQVETRCGTQTTIARPLRLVSRNAPSYSR